MPISETQSGPRAGGRYEASCDVAVLLRNKRAADPRNIFFDDASYRYGNGDREVGKLHLANVEEALWLNDLIDQDDSVRVRNILEIVSDESHMHGYHIVSLNHVTEFDAAKKQEEMIANIIQFDNAQAVEAGQSDHSALRMNMIPPAEALEAGKVRYIIHQVKNGYAVVSRRSILAESTDDTPLLKRISVRKRELFGVALDNHDEELGNLVTSVFTRANVLGLNKLPPVNADDRLIAVYADIVELSVKRWLEDSNKLNQVFEAAYNEKNIRALLPTNTDIYVHRSYSNITEFLRLEEEVEKRKKLEARLVRVLGGLLKHKAQF